MVKSAGDASVAGFDPWTALIGGALIGVASALLMLLTGRIAGISGILGGCLASGAPDRGWRLAFIGGLVIAPLIGGLFGHPLPLPEMPANWAIIVAGGLLVGFGTRLAGGCTSGHGVCGIARLSSRSFSATVIFMLAAIVVVAITRHVLGA